MLVASDLFCQPLYLDTFYTETTKLTKPEREALNHLIEIYKSKAENETDSDNTYFTSLFIAFSKIDSLHRLYNTNGPDEKNYFLSKIEFKISEEINGSNGGDVHIMLNPDFSPEHGYIDISIDYPAACVSGLDVKVIFNHDIYEYQKYFTSCGLGYEALEFRVNGVKKYSGEQDRPYTNKIYY
jgi:hypothetical protein